MSKNHTVFRAYKWVLTLLFFAGIFGATEVSSQDCFTLYGPTGEPALGVNRIMCAWPGSITLTATAPTANAYVWNTGAVVGALPVTAGGIYTVSVASGGNPTACILNFTVNAVTNPIINIGNDTAVCSGDSLVLNATPGYSDYIWSDGATTIDSFVVFIPDTYSVTVTDTNQCTSFDTIIVLENVLPTPDLGNDTIVCPGDTVLIDAGSGYTSYFWTGGATSQTIQVDTVGGNFVTVTDTNSCVGFGQILVGNLVPVTPNIGLDDSICDGGVKVLNAGVGYNSYLWSDNTTLQSASFSATGNPWVEITDTNGCLSRDTMHLEIHALPVINLGPDGSYCINDSLILDAGAGMISYSWNNGVITQTNVITNAGTYSVTVEDTNQCFNSDTNVVTQNALPIVNIGLDIDYCLGFTFSQLRDAGSNFASYTWMDGTFTQNRMITQADDTVWVEVIDTNGCIGSDTLFVFENTPLALDLGPDDTICATQTYGMDAGNPNNAITAYIWSTGATNQTISVPANAALPSDISTDYAVTITDNKGCESSDTMNLVTYALPVPDLGNDTAFCTGDPFSTVLNPGNFVNYAWSTGANSATIIAGAIGQYYSVTVTDSRGCINADDLLITDHPLPTPNLGADEDFCEGSNYSKILSPGGYVTYLWNDGSMGQVIGISAAGLYSVTVTNTNGCVNNDDILIVENPTPDVDLGSDIDYCEDANISHLLDATAQLPGAGFNFLWNTGSTSGTIVATNFGTYSVIVVDQVTNCQAQSSVSIISMQKAQPDLGQDAMVCQGQLIQLSANVTIPGYNYLWSTGATTPSINVFETGHYWVRLDASNGTCIGLTDSVYFNPGVLPVVELGEDQYICEGQNVQLLNSSTAFPDAQYEWQDGAKTTSYLVEQTGHYEVEVRNFCGSVVDQVYIEFQDCSNIYLPNAFTPNGDNKNDTFYPKTDQEMTEYGFWVYDRWGGLAFKTNIPNFGWDGTVNGKYMKAGVYVWRLSYVTAFQEFGERIEAQGEFTLVR